MKITEKQLILLVRVLEGTLGIMGGDRFNLSEPDRERLYNQIINQQSNELVDVKEEEK